MRPLPANKLPRYQASCEDGATLTVWLWDRLAIPAAMTEASHAQFRRNRFPAAIIAHAVQLATWREIALSIDM
jgi:hypothetical protein